MINSLTTYSHLLTNEENYMRYAKIFRETPYTIALQVVRKDIQEHIAINKYQAVAQYMTFIID